VANNQEFKVNKSIEAASYQDKLGTSTQVVNGFDLTAYNISQSTLELDSQLATGQFNRGFTFNDTGTRIFICNDQDDILAYEMDTPYDHVNATYSSSLSVTALSGLTQGTCIRFSDAASGKAYILDYSANTIKQYSLSTMYDMSTATQDTSDTLDTSSEDTSIFSFFFNSDGTKLYAVGRTSPGESIYQYDLTTAWDLSTASYASKSLDISAKAPNANGGVMSSDGKKVILGDSSNDKLVMYTLSTAYDISTGTFTNETSVPSAVTCVGLEVDPTGTRLFFSDGQGSGTGEIRAYDIGSIDIELDLSTGTVFEHRPKDVFYANIKLVNPPASGTLSSATLILHGGTRDSYNLNRINVDNVSMDITAYISGDFYMTGLAVNNSNDEITAASTRFNYFGRFDTFKINDHENWTSWNRTRVFAASTPYSYTGESSLSFSRDGKWMYWSNSYRGRIYWINMDEPFNITESNWITNNTRTLSGSENGLLINPDGTKLYSLDSGSRRIYIHDLKYTGNRYDPSTLSLIDNFYLTAVDSIAFNTSSAPHYMVYSKDGRYLFLSERSTTTKRIFRLALDAPFEINANMTLDQTFDDWEDLTTYSSATDLFAFPIDFNEAGTKMYATYGIDADNVQECWIERYTVGTAIDYITYDSSIKWAGGTAPTMPSVDDTAVYVFNTSDGGTTYNASVAMDGVTGVEQ
jgi:sugar lactone lactonase YvrE